MNKFEGRVIKAYNARLVCVRRRRRSAHWVAALMSKLERKTALFAVCWHSRPGRATTQGLWYKIKWIWEGWWGCGIISAPWGPISLSSGSVLQPLVQRNWKDWFFLTRRPSFSQRPVRGTWKLRHRWCAALLFGTGGLWCVESPLQISKQKSCLCRSLW